MMIYKHGGPETWLYIPPTTKIPDKLDIPLDIIIERIRIEREEERKRDSERPRLEIENPYSQDEKDIWKIIGSLSAFLQVAVWI